MQSCTVLVSVTVIQMIAQSTAYAKRKLKSLLQSH